MSERKDAWTEYEDSVLADTIIFYIENGKTQLEAFDDVAERLQRSAAACGFRWNSTVRKKYEKEIKEAKTKRLENKKQKSVPNVSINFSTDDPGYTPLDEIIDGLQKIRLEYLEMKKKIERLTNELQNKLRPTEDLQNLMQIIRRAEQMGLFERLYNEEKPAG